MTARVTTRRKLSWTGLRVPILTSSCICSPRTAASVSTAELVIARSRNERPEDEEAVESPRFRVQSRVAEKHRSSLENYRLQRGKLATLVLQAAQSLDTGKPSCSPGTSVPAFIWERYALCDCAVPQSRQIPRKKWVAGRLRRSTTDRMSRKGHFAAAEESELLVEDIRAFSRDVRNHRLVTQRSKSDLEPVRL
jgi:hypothetical protein